jgi:ABC-type nitrate/sulfonate/bicarbonate transport system substrate-binding protein
MPHKDPEARKQYQKEYAQRTREAAYARVKEWRAKNPEKLAAQNKRYAQKHPDKLVAKAIRWKKANPEKAAEIARNTRLKNKARVNANKGMYRASKRNRTPAWLTDSDRLKIKCIYQIAAMLTRVNNEPWEVDHIIPLNGKNVSGLHVPSNIWFVKASENRLKNNKYEVKYA